MQTKNKRLVIFDLDGTLINSLEDIAASLNRVLELRGYCTFKTEEYRYLVGNGIRTLVERALPPAIRTEKLIEEIRLEFVEYYIKHSCEYTLPYEGIPQLLQQLSEEGIEMAVASNKFHRGTCQLVAHFFPTIPFRMVLGHREGVPAKPHRAMVDEIIRTVGVDRAQVLYVGDSDVDMRTATNSEVQGIGVTWGFRTREELYQAGAYSIIDHPLELLKQL